MAVLYPMDVIEGDFTLKEINVLARSGVRCAEDNHVKGGGDAGFPRARRQLVSQ
jgi:hypothetical protein